MDAASTFEKKWCVVIPTYNNAKTLKRVIDGVLRYTSDVFIVNDGSTDETAVLLKGYSGLHILQLPENRGKGNALRQGFEQARLLGFEYAVTIDSDGQHYPDDLPVFLEEMEKSSKPLLLIGSRNMMQESVPRKSSFGNRFSNFWFWFETGIRLTDTQSGYRLYPLNVIPKKYFTKKFEFEIEIIVRTAWNGVEVRNVPVRVLYDPEERVSHFRPFRDFTRISVLNTVLVIITLLYIKPRNFIRKFKKKSFKDFVREDILQTNDTNEVKAASLALGVFLGIIPVWGFQTFLSIFLAAVFRLNKAISFVGSNISIPPMIPLVVWASLKIGGVLIPSDDVPHLNFSSISYESVKLHLVQYIAGSFILATFMSVISGLGCYAFLRTFNRKNTRNV